MLTWSWRFCIILTLSSLSSLLWNHSFFLYVFVFCLAKDQQHWLFKISFLNVTNSFLPLALLFHQTSFKISSLFLIFSGLTIVCLNVTFFLYYWLNFTVLPKFLSWHFWSVLEILNHSLCFCPILPASALFSLLSLKDSNYLCVRPLPSVPYVYIRFSVFSLFSLSLVWIVCINLCSNSLIFFMSSMLLNTVIFQF